MADVFISYAREDFASARVLADRLTAAGCSVWWDPEIRFGEDYTAVITRELAAALCVVVLWSRHSVQSDWVLDEAQRASGRLIPIRLDNAEVPLGFGRIQSATLLEGVISEQCVAVIKTFARTYSKRRRLKWGTAAAILIVAAVATFAGFQMFPGKPQPNPKSHDVERRSSEIEGHVRALTRIESSNEFYGPLDPEKIRAEKSQWNDYARALEDGHAKCLKDTPSDPQCFDALLSRYPAPEKLPPPGKKVPLAARQLASDDVVNFAATQPYDLVSEPAPYTKPLTVLVKGQWTGYYTGNDESRCVDITAPVFRFRGGGRVFTLYHPEQRMVAASITKTPLPAPSGNAYAMVNWPADSPLAVEYYDARDYPKRAICPTDRPYVLMWQNDSRINKDDPYAAVGLAQ